MQSLQSMLLEVCWYWTANRFRFCKLQVACDLTMAGGKRDVRIVMNVANKTGYEIPWLKNEGMHKRLGGVVRLG